MAEFRVEEVGDDGYGRLGKLCVPHGPVDTPALFPVINFIGGTTEKSGGIWRRIRDNLIDGAHLDGIMFQAMSFSDYGVSPDNLKNFWREKTFHERFSDLDAPVFIDSGGFKLMNSNTFGQAPVEGGAENEWGLYTNPKSILGLQIDFGADIIATLDYPIPPKLNEEEKVERMERSIDSAVECLEIIENPDKLNEGFPDNDDAVERLKKQKRDKKEPGVYVALHGHDYETVNWYVGTFLERIETANVGESFEGFAIGSLVPLRSSIDTLVDIVQGAKDAIPSSRSDEIGIHVFGIGGKQVSLLSLLGVDTFDCSTHVQTATYAKYTVPGTWESAHINDLEPYLVDGDFPCDLENCTLCGPDSGIDYDLLVKELNLDLSYDERQERKENGERIKSDYYAALARHNFEVYNDELHRVRRQIRDGTLLEYVIDFARNNPNIKQGLKQAQLRDKTLREDLEDREAYDLVAGPDLTSDQTKLHKWGGGVDESTETRSISLKYNPSSFNILSHKYEPPTDKRILLLVPCSQKKPYTESRTHSVLEKKLKDVRSQIHKVTVSGMYGPVPEEKENEDAVLSYEYMLTSEDENQIELVTERLRRYLETYGEQYDAIVAYVASSQYRGVIESAIKQSGVEEVEEVVFPQNPQSLQLTEHFRNKNLQQLVDHLDNFDLKQD